LNWKKAANTAIEVNRYALRGADQHTPERTGRRGRYRR
jgi:hypothetical protein